MKYISTLFVLLFLSGCIGATSSNQPEHQYEEYLNIGRTPKVSVKKIFGTPDQKEIASSGYEYWEYHLKNHSPKVNVISTTPQVVSHKANRTTTGHYDLKVFIDPHGILFDYEYIERDL